MSDDRQRWYMYIQYSMCVYAATLTKHLLRRVDDITGIVKELRPKVVRSNKKKKYIYIPVHMIN